MEYKKPHGNKIALRENKNAEKAIKKSSRTAFRITDEQRARFEQAAEKAGLSLSQWFIMCAEKGVENG